MNGPVYELSVFITYAQMPLINAPADVSSYARDLNFLSDASSTPILCVCEQQRPTPEPVLLAKTVSIEISRTGPNVFPALYYNRASSKLAN